MTLAPVTTSMSASSWAGYSVKPWSAAQRSKASKSASGSEASAGRRSRRGTGDIASSSSLTGCGCPNRTQRHGRPRRAGRVRCRSVVRAVAAVPAVAVPGPAPVPAAVVARLGVVPAVVTRLGVTDTASAVVARLRVAPAVVARLGVGDTASPVVPRLRVPGTPTAIVARLRVPLRWPAPMVVTGGRRDDVSVRADERLTSRDGTGGRAVRRDRVRRRGVGDGGRSGGCGQDGDGCECGDSVHGEHLTVGCRCLIYPSVQVPVAIEPWY